MALDVALLLPAMVGMVFVERALIPLPGGTPRPAERGTILLLAATLIYLAAVVVCQVAMLSRRGQSFGKRAMKIRIVRLDGSQPGFLHAVLLRMFVNALPTAIPVVGRLYTLVDLLFIFRPDRRCLHDRIAGTRVVKADAPTVGDRV